MNPGSMRALAAILVAALLLDLSPAQADCIDYVTRDPFLGSVPVGNADRITVFGNYAYLLGTTGVDIVDITDPSNPAVVYTMPVIPGATDLLAIANYLYVAATNEIRVYTLVSPADPSFLTSVALPATPVRLAMRSPVLVAPAGAGGTYIVDASIPGAPTLAFTAPPITDAVDAAFFGPGLQALLLDQDGVRVVDLTQPYSPALLSTIPSSSFSNAYSDGVEVVADGTLAAVLTADQNTNWILDLWDLGSPAVPALRSSIGALWSHQAIVGNVLYVSRSITWPRVEESTLAFDVSNPSAPVLLGDLPWGGQDVVVDGDRLFTASASPALVALDVTDPGTTLPVSTVSSPGIALMKVVGDRAYFLGRGNFAQGFLGLVVLDASQLASGVYQELGVISWSSGTAQALVTDGNLLALTDFSLLEFYDVSTDFPVFQSQYSLDGPGTGLMIGSTQLLAPWFYATSRSKDELRILDVSDPANPFEAGSPVTLPEIDTVLGSVPGYLLVTGASSGLSVYDLATPTAPVLVPTGPLTGGADALEVFGDRAALRSSATGELTIVDLADPTAPAVLDQIPGDAAETIFSAVGSLLYVSSADSTLVDVWDLAPLDSGLPAEMLETLFVDEGAFSLSGYDYSLTTMAPLDDGLLMGHQGILSVFPYVYWDGWLGEWPGDCGTTPTAAPEEAPLPLAAGPGLRLRGPNPFRDDIAVDLVLPRRESVRLTVHDVTGRRVRELVAAELPAGVVPAAWDGRDDAGRPVGSGIYFLRLEAGGEQAGEKVVHLR